MRRKLGKSLAIVGLGMAALAPGAAAQRHGPGGYPPNQGVNISFRGRPQRAAIPRSSLWLGSPYWYADYTPQPPAGIEPQVPQVVVVQAPPAEAQPDAKLPEPLMIELEGEHYVRFQGAEATQRRIADAQGPSTGAMPSSSRREMASVKPEGEALSPVVLIYRDGRRASVREYTIVDDTLYASGDYWVDGYWQKKIQVSSLNIPATIKTNQEHGVNFVLPSSSDEVITRP